VAVTTVISEISTYAGFVSENWQLAEIYQALQSQVGNKKFKYKKSKFKIN